MFKTEEPHESCGPRAGGHSHRRCADSRDPGGNIHRLPSELLTPPTPPRQLRLLSYGTMAGVGRRDGFISILEFYSALWRLHISYRLNPKSLPRHVAPGQPHLPPRVLAAPSLLPWPAAPLTAPQTHQAHADPGPFAHASPFPRMLPPRPTPRSLLTCRKSC